MSLQVWLPLTGDLENNGLGEITINSRTIAGYSDGKIGKALSLLNSCYDFTVPSLVDSKVFSCVFWFKQNPSSSLTTNWRKIVSFVTKAEDGSSTSTGLFRFESSYGNQSYVISTHSNAAYQVCPSNVGNRALVSETGVWHHVALTVDGTTITYYVDGVLHHSGAQTSGLITGRVRIGENNNSADGWLNDLRIYDHALSQKEVKELSKGLIGHWPLNDGVGGENLLKKSEASNAIISENALGTSSFEMQGWVVTLFSTTWMNNHLTVGETYILSFKVTCLWIPTDSSLTRKEVRASPILVHQRSGWNQTITTNDGVKTTAMEIGESRIYHITFTFAMATESANYYGLCGYTYRFADSSNANAQFAKFRIDGLKLEKGSIATPWIPAPSDDLYSAMGLDEKIFYDCSGYGHNGENTGCSVNPNSARYHVSTAFDGTSYITLHNDSFPVILSNDFTLSMWIYSDDDGDRSLWLGNYGISNGGNFFGFEKTVSNSVRFWWNNGSPDKYFATYITKSEGWVLLTLVKEGNVAKIYKNGVLSTTNTSDLYVSANLPSTATTFRLGADGRITGNTLFKGSMSDVRIYCTALSAEDIKALYETSVSIDDKGNFHAYEISEV